MGLYSRLAQQTVAVPATAVPVATPGVPGVPPVASAGAFTYPVATPVGSAPSSAAVARPPPTVPGLAPTTLPAPPIAPGQGSLPPSAPPVPGTGSLATGFPNPSTAQGPSAGLPPHFNAVLQKLQSIVRANSLDIFYPPQRIYDVAVRVANVRLEGLAQMWSMPFEVIQDLYALSLYDVVIYADDSGSMVMADYGERVKDLKVVLEQVATVATMFDDDGISIRFINSKTEGNNVTTPELADKVVQQVNFSGMTPIGTQLKQKILIPFVYEKIQRGALTKPVLLITITDGEPAGEPRDTLQKVMRECSGWLTSVGFPAKTITYQLAQVGMDQAAQRFLSGLDNDPQVKALIDATSAYELEEAEFKRKNPSALFTPYIWLLKLMMGAIDPSYDEAD